MKYLPECVCKTPEEYIQVAIAIETLAYHNKNYLDSCMCDDAKRNEEIRALLIQASKGTKMTKLELVKKAINFAMSVLCDGYLDMPCGCEGCPLLDENNLDDDGNVDCRGKMLKEFVEQYEKEISNDISKWIPTSKQMPPDEEIVIGFTPVDKSMFIGYHREDWRDLKGKWICLGPMGAPRVVTKKVTHWMWCPEVPEV